METDLLSLFSLLSTSLARAIDREKDPARSENQFDLAASNERITDVRFLKLPPPDLKAPGDTLHAKVKLSYDEERHSDSSYRILF